MYQSISHIGVIRQSREENPMPPPSTFLSLIAQLRAGDETAWTHLVRDYGSVIVRVARTRLGDPRVSGLLDAEDIRQSVLRSLFLRMSNGQFELSEPKQLVSLLSVMARNKSINHLKSERRRPKAELSDEVRTMLRVRSADDIAAQKDELEATTRQMSPHERRLLEMRQGGYSWDEIGLATGKSPDAERKRLRRALQHIQDSVRPNTNDE